MIFKVILRKEEGELAPLVQRVVTEALSKSPMLRDVPVKVEVEQTVTWVKDPRI